MFRLVASLRTATVGGVILAVIAFFMGLFDGLFNGLGDNGNGNGQQKAAPAKQDESVSEEPTPKPPEAQNQAPSRPSPKVVHILIDGREYYLLEKSDGEKESQPIELSELVELAQSASGNENGIKVRISRSPTSRLKVERLLKEKLKESGLKKEAIHWEEDLMQ